MSTVFVSGEELNGAAAETELKECHLNIGLDVTSNAYVHTFEIRRGFTPLFSVTPVKFPDCIIL